MTASRTILALAAAAAIGSGVAWSPLAQAQSSANPTTSRPTASSAAPAAHAPAATAPSAKAASSASTKDATDAKVEARIAQLHKQLKITPDQDKDWNAMAQDMRDNARKMSSLMQERATTNKSKPMTAVDNLKSYADIADTHADGLKKILPDFQKLYDEMSPAQKKTADTIFNQRVNQRVRTTASPSSNSRS